MSAREVAAVQEFLASVAQVMIMMSSLEIIMVIIGDDHDVSIGDDDAVIIGDGHDFINDDGSWQPFQKCLASV